MSIAAYQGVCPTCLHDHSAPITALASGSGDHAELARAMERAKENAMALALTERAEFAEAELQRSTANMCEQFNRAEALLAENAALRAESENARTVVAWANNSLFGSCGYFHGEPFDGLHLARPIEELKDRATEAERKLAEAAGLLREARDEIQAHADGATPEWQRRVYDSSRSDYAQDMDIPNRIDAFLSKEAERG